MSLNQVLKLVLITTCGLIAVSESQELNCFERIPFPFYSKLVEKYEKKHYDPDALRSVPEMIESRGWKAESHYVITPDGYILGVQRIVRPGPGSGNAGLKPVLFAHGLLSSSADFVMNDHSGQFDPTENVTQLRAEFLEDYDPKTRTYRPGPGRRAVGRNIAFETARMGFDVWLLNVRGNLYSTNHTNLNPCISSQFWDFGLDQISQVDLPTVIKYVCTVSGQCDKQGLGYVGFSQGTEIMFMRMSRDKATNELISPFIALAPVAQINHAKLILPLFIAGPIGDKILGKFAGLPLLPYSKAISVLLDLVCGTSHGEALCDRLMGLLAGFDIQNTNRTRSIVYIKHVPGGTSLRNLAHWGQVYDRRGPAEYDYGLLGNVKHYHSFSSPRYNLSAITSKKIALFYGDNDYLADLRDATWLRDLLAHNPLLDDYRVPNKRFNHFDFVIAQDTDRLINPQALYLLLKN